MSIKQRQGNKLLMSPEWEKRIREGICPVCGKENKRQYRCCCPKCTAAFWKKAIWSFELRPKVFLRDKFICQKCGYDHKKYMEWHSRFIKWGSEQNTFSDYYDKYLYEKETKDMRQEQRRLDNDHIIAIALGGDEYDMNNMQTLCEDCHKEKTKEDIKKIALKRKNQTTIEAFQ